MKLSVNLMSNGAGQWRYNVWLEREGKNPVLVAEGIANDKDTARRLGQQAAREYEESRQPLGTGPADPLDDGAYDIHVDLERRVDGFHHWCVTDDSGKIVAEGKHTDASIALQEAQQALDKIRGQRGNRMPAGVGPQQSGRRPREVTETRGVDWSAVGRALKPVAAKQARHLERLNRQTRQLVEVQKKACIAAAKRAGQKGWLFEHGASGWWIFIPKEQCKKWEDDGRGDTGTDSPARRERFLLKWLSRGATRKAI